MPTELRAAVLGRAGAMKQQILVEPTSSAPIGCPAPGLRPRLVAACSLRRHQVSRAPRLAAHARRARAIAGRTRRSGVRRSIDLDVPREHARARALEPGQRAQAASAPIRRQPDLDTVVEMQVPAPSPTQARAADPRREVGLARQQREQIGGVLRRLAPTTQRQPGEARDLHSLISCPSRSIRRKLPPCCQSATGCRSSMRTQSGRAAGAPPLTLRTQGRLSSRSSHRPGSMARSGWPHMTPRLPSSSSARRALASFDDDLTQAKPASALAASSARR